MGKKVMSVTIEWDLYEEQADRLRKLLPSWQTYRNENGQCPFASWGIEDLFRVVMEIGSYYRINEAIQSEETRQELFKSRNPGCGNSQGIR